MLVHEVDDVLIRSQSADDVVIKVILADDLDPDRGVFRVDIPDLFDVGSSACSLRSVLYCSSSI